MGYNSGITTMGGRAGGGARGGGGLNFDATNGRTAFGKAADKMAKAYQGGSAADRAAARKQMESLVKRMPTDRLKTAAKNASEAAWLSSKSNNPASMYSHSQFQLNTALSKIYNTELSKRK